MFNNYSNFPQYGGYQQAPAMNQPPVNYAPPPGAYNWGACGGNACSGF